jgi:ammonia channel protein AmtB
MLLTVEFFIGLIAFFFIGYLIATGLEKIFHLTLDESEWQNLKPDKSNKHE